MATRPPSSASSSSSSSNEHRILSPDTPWDPVTIPDTFSRYSGFKYRVWFIWSIWYRYSVIWPSSPPWFAIICGSDGNGDLWLWEEEDEEGIREFAIGNQPLSVSQITEEGNDAFQITEEDWNDAFQALEAHFFPDNGSRQSGPLRKQTVIHVAEISSIATLIYSWAQVTDLPLTGGTCDVCGVSGVLPVWIETMLESAIASTGTAEVCLRSVTVALEVRMEHSVDQWSISGTTAASFLPPPPTARRRLSRFLLVHIPPPNHKEPRACLLLSWHSTPHPLALPGAQDMWRGTTPRRLSFHHAARCSPPPACLRSPVHAAELKGNHYPLTVPKTRFGSPLLASPHLLGAALPRARRLDD
ncbi:hypothetical protein B0H14DRAFT_3748784 [Mycena olivaceomarginata]|nr:hypothetical protein B0H14DRAFT_3748784 [Mycena olivaceomarginata]